MLVHLHLATRSVNMKILMFGKGGHSVCENEGRSVLGWREVDVNNHQLFLPHYPHEGGGFSVIEGVKDKTYL